MKIIELQAENVKRLKAVSIRPGGNLVEITGRNGQGKTSVLDAIWWALTGATHIQAAPIRKGAAKARIRLDLGEMIVTRTFAERDEGKVATSITVETEGGARYPSPQKVLDELVGAISLDPLALLRADPKAQFNMLRVFAPEVDFDAIETANKADYSARTELNRRAKEVRAAADRISVPADTPDEEIAIDDLLGEMEKASEENSTLARRQERREETKRESERLDRSAAAQRENAARLRQQADDAMDLAAKLEAEADDLRDKLEAAGDLPEPIDVSALRERVSAARRTNDAVGEKRRRAELVGRADDLESQARAKTDAMAARSLEKMEAISAAKLPVEGLGFGDGEILLDGVPFNQASDAEQLRASVSVAMASEPKLRVIRIRDGSLLDDEAMTVLASMADAADYQVWIERVDGSGKVGFVLEDGEVSHAGS